MTRNQFVQKAFAIIQRNKLDHLGQQAANTEKHCKESFAYACRCADRLEETGQADWIQKQTPAQTALVKIQETISGDVLSNPEIIKNLIETL